MSASRHPACIPFQLLINFRSISDADSTDEMDMDNYGDDFKVVAKGKRKPYEVDYESLSQQAVEKLMQRDVDHICGIFGVEVGLRSLFILQTGLGAGRDPSERCWSRLECRGIIYLAGTCGVFETAGSISKCLQSP